MLGGIQDGWIGETSVPITSQFGYLSAKSLREGLEENMDGGSWSTYIAQSPVPVPISTTF